MLMFSGFIFEVILIPQMEQLPSRSNPLLKMSKYKLKHIIHTEKQI